MIIIIAFIIDFFDVEHALLIRIINKAVRINRAICGYYVLLTNLVRKQVAKNKFLQDINQNM